MANEVFYTIEKILDRKKVKDKYKYKIKWEGYPMDQCTWEPVENLQYSLRLVEEYNKNHPIKNIKIKQKKNKDKTESLLKQKRKHDNTKMHQIVNNESMQNNTIQNNNGNIKNAIIENEIETDISYNIDKSFTKIVTVKRQNETLMAVVDKLLENGEKATAYLPTEKLRIDNPWILLDFYESKIKFT